MHDFTRYFKLSATYKIGVGKTYRLIHQTSDIYLFECGKGRINSKGIYEVIDFPNYQLKNFKDFCNKSLFEAQSKISTNNFEYAWQT